MPTFEEWRASILDEFDAPKKEARMPSIPHSVTAPPRDSFWRAVRLFEGEYFSPSPISSAIYREPVARLYEDRDEAHAALLKYVKSQVLQTDLAQGTRKLTEQDGMIILASEPAGIFKYGVEPAIYGLAYYTSCRSGRITGFEFSTPKATDLFEAIRRPLVAERDRLLEEKLAKRREQLRKFDTYLFASSGGGTTWR